MVEILRQPAEEHVCKQELHELSLPAQTIVLCSCGQKWICVKSRSTTYWARWTWSDELVYVLTGKVPSLYRD